jgi:hypothetical protein
MNGPDAELWENYLDAIVENDMSVRSEFSGDDELDSKAKNSIIKLVATLCLLSSTLVLMWLLLAL